MTKAKSMLVTRGLTIDSKRPNDQNPAIYWKGEWVGYISEYGVSLHQDLPSLGLTQPNELIPFSDSDADGRLRRKIDTLKDSQRRYEERMRQDKVDTIRDYFNRRKNAVNEQEQFMLAEMC